MCTEKKEALEKTMTKKMQAFVHREKRWKLEMDNTERRNRNRRKHLH
jgi:hypothetical protein